MGFSNYHVSYAYAISIYYDILYNLPFPLFGSSRTERLTHLFVDSLAILASPLMN
jgi:hypothetical protein